MQLRTPMAFANMSAYLKFKIAPALKRRDAKFELLTNGLARGKRSDGFYGMRLYGPLRTMRPIPSRFGPRGAGGAAGGAGRGARRGRFGGTRGVGGAGGAGRLPGRRFGR